MQIKDVERMTRLTAKAIRLYEEKGLIAVTRGENAYRDYDEETVKRLHTIRYLRGAGVSIPDIRLYSDGVLTLRELLNKRRYEIRNASEELLTEAVFPIIPSDIYFRLTVIDEAGRCADTNAYFTDEVL